MPEKNDKKQRVIHTRVSESLEKELKEKAADLGVSVSNLVRNLLMNTVDLVEDIVVDSARIAGSARGERPADEGLDHAAGGAGEAQPGPVLGWQEMILNLNAVCVHCNAILAKGSRAGIGVMAGAAAPPIICGSCLGRLGEEPDEELVDV